MNKSSNRFAAGSGCYDCNVCGHKTRATDPDAASLGQCELCYDLGGWENSLSNGHCTQEEFDNHLVSLQARYGTERLVKSGYPE